MQLRRHVLHQARERPPILELPGGATAHRATLRRRPTARPVRARRAAEAVKSDYRPTCTRWSRSSQRSWRSCSGRCSCSASISTFA